MAPSFPLTVTVELAFGADPEADPSGWTWTDVSADLRYADRVRVSRGRSDERSEAEPSQCSLTLLNTGGDYTPGNASGAHYPDVVLGVPLRVTVTTDGVDYRRFAGFVSQWAPEWPAGDLSPPFALVRVTADGVLRRMRRGEQPLSSPLFRSISMHDDVVAYWPCEDGSEAAEAASPLDGVAPLAPSGVEFGASREQGDGSILFGASQVMKIPDPSRNVMGRVPNHTPGDHYVIQLAWMMPDTATSDRAVMDVRSTSSTHARWQLRVSSTQFQVRAWDADDAEVVNSTEAVGDVFGRWVRAQLILSDDGAGVLSWTATLYALDADQTVLNRLSASPPSSTLGRVTRAGVNGPGMFQERYAAHINVLTSDDSEILRRGNLHDVFRGYDGERAMRRFERLCDEQGLQCTATSASPLGARRVDDAASGLVSCPDAAALDITGDIELRADATPDTWRVAAGQQLLSKSASSNESYGLAVDSSGNLVMEWSTDGSARSSLTSNAALPKVFGRLAVRATLDVDNGSTQHEATFYYAESFAAAANGWTQLGDTRTGSGVTSIHSGSADLEAGSFEGGGVLAGVIHGLEVYDGIGGTLVADPDFSAEEQGTSSFSDGQGNTWTLTGDTVDIGHVDDSMPMGPQPVDTLLNIFREVEVADGGIFGEDDFGLFYRTRTSLHNQTVALSLAAATDIVNPFRPALDDLLNVVSDVTAKKPDGTSARAVDTTKPTYETSVTANVSTDDWLRQVAYWLLHLGTWPGMRYPQVSPALVRTPSLITSWGVLDEGDRVQVTGLPAEHPADDVDLLARGWSEEITPDEWLASVNASPAGPYTVAVFGTDRFDASDTSSTLNAALNDSATSFDVATTGQPWVNDTDHAAEFPFDVEVGGEVMTVSGITGSTSPQTFSVTRSVNGVTKSHSSGDSVRLAQRPVFA